MPPISIQRNEFTITPTDKEIHLLFSVEDPLLSFNAQLDHIFTAFTQERMSYHAQVVFLRVFVSDAANQEAEVMNRLLDDGGFPVSIVQQAPANGTKVAMWAYLKTKAEVRVLPGGLYETKGSDCTQLWTAGLTAKANDSKAQATLILEQYVMALLGQGLTLKDNCMRTWFFVNDIDNQYAGMVKARNDVFKVQGLTADTHYIASTGIGGRVAEHDCWVYFDAVAYRDIQPSQIHYLYASDHLNRTSDYGVSFERGTAIDLPGRRQVFISGTASIDDHGQVLHKGDVIAQAQRMMENISALLAEADCTTDDIQEAVVYLRDPSDYARVSRFFHDNYPSLPHLIVNAPVCRPAWLIETECMAIKHSI